MPLPRHLSFINGTKNVRWSEDRKHQIPNHKELGWIPYIRYWDWDRQGNWYAKLIMMRNQRTDATDDGPSTRRELAGRHFGDYELKEEDL